MSSMSVVASTPGVGLSGLPHAPPVNAATDTAMVGAAGSCPSSQPAVVPPASSNATAERSASRPRRRHLMLVLMFFLPLTA